jgi:dihydrofolate reductase
MEAIYAVDLKGGLSKDGKIPWKSKKDLTFFANKTMYNVVIMGKNTYFSLPEKYRPLKNRLNIVLTSNPDVYKNTEEKIKNNNLVFTDYDKIYNALISEREKIVKSHPYLHSNFKIFFIGGKTIYEKFIPLCNKVWVTKIKKDYDCDLYFNYEFKLQFNKSQIIDDNNELQICLYER